MNKLIAQLYPFFLIGVAIVAVAFGIILLAYLFLFGAIIGVFLFLVTWIRKTFFHKKNITVKKTSGRIIDSDDWRKL